MLKLDLMFYELIDNKILTESPYMVSNVVTDLDCLGFSQASGPLLKVPTAQAGWWNLLNMSPPNISPRPDDTPCSM